MKSNHVLGIDVGASGIKGAIVDIKSGKLLTERLRLETPKPATPKAMAAAVGELVNMHSWSGLIGCGFPSIIKKGKVYSAANIDPSWIGKNAAKLFSKASGCPVTLLNDADAAGIAAIQYGIGKGKKGVVLFITIGSGLGSALFHNGTLVPNTEFGHVYLNGMVAEHYAADSVRKIENLSWEEWGKRFSQYLNHIQRIIYPDLVILGGGASKHYEIFKEFLHLTGKVKPSTMRNKAGIIGAAYYAWEQWTAGSGQPLVKG